MRGPDVAESSRPGGGRPRGGTSAMPATIPSAEEQRPVFQHGHPPQLLQCPSCGSSNVAQVLGDNGGVSYVCTACGHIWS
ncbi:hypothetical protein DEH18_06255 [Streptomyces sp. NHF165]|nr:hypothetical protein DEH18_06255 [Streptomyces sp. NHF165]